MSKLIIYYSLSNNTQEAAEYLARELGADLSRIELVKPMPDDFKKQILVGGMQSTFNMTPKIKGVPSNIDEYEEIIVGGPIWAGKIAAPINTFIKKYHIAEKVTAVFTCSGGGDNDKCIALLEKILPNMKANVPLADRSHNTAVDNIEKLKNFVEVIR